MTHPNSQEEAQESLNAQAETELRSMTPSDNEALNLLRELFDESAPWSLGDWIYDVRSRAMDNGMWEGSSWDHPDVKRYGDLLERCEALLKSSRDRDTV